MEAGKHVLNRSEFIESGLRLVNALSNKEKHDLLKKPKKAEIPAYTFHV